MRRVLSKHTVALADEMGWAELANGDLLRAAESAGFEVMLTCDQSISYQQNMTGRRLALVVLSTNRWKILKLDLETIAHAISIAVPGSFQSVQIAAKPD